MSKEQTVESRRAFGVLPSGGSVRVVQTSPPEGGTPNTHAVAYRDCGRYKSQHDRSGYFQSYAIPLT